jgi:Tol biopolymer transport system component
MARRYRRVSSSPCSLFSLVHDVLDAVVSPDGKRVIFSATPSEDIWLGAIDVDGSNLTIYPVPAPLPGRRARNLSLSPNGQACAFTWNRQVSYRGEGQVWVMDADGSNQRPLGPADTYDYDLAWSPDGRTLAFARWDSPDPDMRSTERAAWISSLWLIDVASGQERLLLSSEGQYAHWSPRWLPDGAGLVLLSTRGGAADLWFVRPDGTGLQQLTRQGGLAGEIAVPGP